ncbi:MAG: hypothetical protein GVY19_00315, partial [Bacteroidetes bacterium]|nr:hypothetical protein [Bacteroidota bacterium]
MKKLLQLKMRLIIFVFIMIGAGATAQNLNNPVAYWPFDGTVGDSSGNGTNGTIVGDVTFEQGVIGQCLKSVGTLEEAGYVDLGYDDSQPIYDITSDFSISFWYKRNADEVPNSTYYKPIIADKNKGDLSAMLLIHENKIGFRPEFAQNVNYSLDSGKTWQNSGHGDNMMHDFDDWPMADEEWHHIAFSYVKEDSMFYQFIDGEQVHAQPYVDCNINLEDTIQILNYTKPGEDNRYLPIFLDELRVYDVGLNSIEINDLYNFRIEVEPVPSVTGVNLAFTDSSINVHWDAAEGATGYGVYRSVNNGNTFLEVANIGDGDSTHYIDTEFILDRETFYYIKAYNSQFVADNSDTTSITKPGVSDEPATGSWDAPIAYWKFNGDVEDYSGNEQHGTIVGDVSYVQGFAGPNGGQAIKSVGTLDDAGYVDLGKDTEDAIHDITTDFSIAFWYKGDTTNVPGGTWFKPIISDGGAFSVVLMKNDDEEV